MAEVLLTLTVRQDNRARTPEDTGPNVQVVKEPNRKTGKLVGMHFLGKDETQMYDVTAPVTTDNTVASEETKAPHLQRNLPSNDATLLPSHGKRAKLKPSAWNSSKWVPLERRFKNGHRWWLYCERRINCWWFNTCKIQPSTSPRTTRFP